MKDVNVQLADAKEEIEELRFQLEQSKKIADEVPRLSQENETLKLALQACNERIRLYDATLTGLRLTIEGLNVTTQRQQ